MMNSFREYLLICLLAWLAAGMAVLEEARAQPMYQKPPRAVLDILDAPPTPQVSLSPTRDRLMLVQGTRYPPIADLAAPMLRLAGLRINPATNGPHRPPRVTGLTLQSLADGKQAPVKLPADAAPGTPSWSPDGKRFVFTNTLPDGIELWVGDAATGETRRVPTLRLVAVLGDAVQWMPDSRTLLCQCVPSGRGPVPTAPPVPPGPNIQESVGRAGPVRTYQDLLRDAHDEQLFDYFATAQPVLVDTQSLETKPLGKPAVYTTMDPAPDGKHLLVARVNRPYSYLHPLSSFPRTVEVWDLAGATVYKLADLSLADRVPIEGVRTGPRGYEWHPTEPATLVWAEALDEGDPKKKVPHRDRVRYFRAPFQGEPLELLKTEERLSGVSWGERDGFALVSDYDRDRKRRRTFVVRLGGAEPPKMLWDRSIQDRYGDPGSPLSRTLPTGHRALRMDGDTLFLSGSGASPRGDHPFLDRFNYKTGKTDRVFECAEDCYESVVALRTDDGSEIITRYETRDDPPNYFLRTVRDGGRKQLTSFTDPAPQLRGVTKKLVTYKRDDGVPLSFMLYLPPNYKEGERLPTVMWAYPREYVSADDAGQVSGSTHRFTTITGPSHLFFLTQGYAVLDDTALPVIGDPETVNNTYIAQIVAGAKAAIDKAAELGVTDPKRVGVGGHSYGAFMTANLLAHSDLFRAGIARSGAYNRTLTPFGFQSERRTLWEARETYGKMSPFMFADQIREPLLLIHGEADNNPGTFPIQSERMYQAVRGNGGTVRYVTLPYESHGYLARESVEHTLYEMINWFDRYVKNASQSTDR